MFARDTGRMIVRHVSWTHLSCAALGVLALAAPVLAQDAAGDAASAGRVEIGGQTYPSFQAYVQSGAFRQAGGRCGYVSPGTVSESARAGGGDCSATFTNPDEGYEPDGTTEYVIPVVVHIIRNSAGSMGNISLQLVESQIQVLNEDFLAIQGTNGELGRNGRIRFELATEEPDGTPTTGITLSNDDQWFADAGAYYNTLAWDPTEYLNIYTNQASGNLGYVPFLPQEGPAGSNADRVVIHWQAFGSPGIGGPPYDLGRTVTHEVGHYLGVHHPFRNGCQPGTEPGCYSSGDLICDTGSQEVFSGSDPTCTNTKSCGSDDNMDNYMDYGDDVCMQRFTLEQVRRMRCTLENYRDTLFDEVPVPTETTSWGGLKNMFK